MIDKGTCPVCSVPIEVNNPDNLPDYTCDCLKCHALLIRMDGKFQHYQVWASKQKYSKWKVQKKGRKDAKIPPRKYYKPGENRLSEERHKAEEFKKAFKEYLEGK